MALQSNLWFASVPPSNVPQPGSGYYAVFIADGTENTRPGVVYLKDENGGVTTAASTPDSYTDDMARAAIRSILASSSSVDFVYDDIAGLLSATVRAAGIDSVHIIDAAVTTAKINDAAVTDAKLAASAVVSSKIAVAAVGTSALADAAVTSDKICDACVTNAKIADSAITNLKLADGSVTNAKLADSSVGNLKLADASVSNTKLEDGAVTNAKIGDGSISGVKLAANAVNSTTVLDGAIIGSKIADGAINASKMAAGAVGSLNIIDGAVTGSKLAASAVSSAAIADGSITNAKLGTDAVTNAKIADAAVNTAELVDAAVTNVKLAAMAQATFKMRAAAAGTGAPIDGTAAQAKAALAITASDVTGLGTAASMNSTAFDAAGAAAAAQAASQPLDADLTAIAALSTTSYGRSLLTLADATAQTALLNTATTALKGLMSATDKLLLDGLNIGTYNVLSYGINPGNTPAANLSLWNSIVAAIPDNSTVWFPPLANAYQFSDTLTIPAGKHLRITGSSNQKSIIQTTNPSSDIFTVGDWYNEFNGLKFTSSVTRTGGAAINSGNNVAINVTNCDFAGMWDGIVYTGGANAGNLALISNCGFTGTLNRGIVIDGTNANTVIEKVIMDGTSGVQQAGLELLQCGSVLVSNCDLIRSVNNLRVNPTSPNGVFSAYFVNVFFDTSPASSVKFMGTGNVQRVKFVNCWFSGSVIGCEFASTAATLPTAIDFTNCDIFGNSGRGIYANGVQDFAVAQCRIAGNTIAGVEASASPGSATKFNVTNNSICPTAGFGGNGTGVLINAGTYGGYAIKNNDVRNNVTANITDSGSVATTDLKIINDNVGHILTGSVGNLSGTAATSSTSTTALLSVRVPAKAATAGQVFRFRLQGNSSSLGSITFRVFAGPNGNTSDTQVWVSTTSGAQAANERAGFDGTLTVRAPGASGTVQCEALGFAHTALLPTAVAAPATPTVNTNNAWFITLAATCSIGVFTAQQAVVEAL